MSIGKAKPLGNTGRGGSLGFFSRMDRGWRILGDQAVGETEEDVEGEC